MNTRQGCGLVLFEVFIVVLILTISKFISFDSGTTDNEILAVRLLISAGIVLLSGFGFYYIYKIGGNKK